jgi:hypothetical protein
LHPIGEYAVNCGFLGERFEFAAKRYLRECPTVDLSSGIPNAWEFTNSDEDRTLLTLIAARLDHGWTIRPTTQELFNQLTDAVALVLQVSPALGADALSYTRRHVVVKTDRMIGRTWVDLGGLTVSGDPAFSSIAQLAESLYHEALHSKYYAIERGLRLPIPDEATSPTPVVIPWQHDVSGIEQQWTAHRSLDAYYVYVHLAVFRVALLHLTQATSDLDRLRKVCFRAGYLSRQLDTVCEDFLDDERLSMKSWLDRCRVKEFDLNQAGLDLLSGAATSR